MDIGYPVQTLIYVHTVHTCICRRESIPPAAILSHESGYPNEYRIHGPQLVYIPVARTCICRQESISPVPETFELNSVKSEFRLDLTRNLTKNQNRL